MSDLSKLEEHAASIPSMGGLKVGPLLRKAAKRARDGTAVVEVGSWLGAGSAQLALGVAESERNISLHCFDRWQASAREASKAKKAGLKIKKDQDTLPIVKKYLKPFGVDIHFHKGEVRDIAWDGGRISVFVDDAAKGRSAFQTILRTFGPSWIPGRTVLFLMDYYYYEKKGEDSDMRCQKDFIEAHPENFEQIGERSKGASMAQFRYIKKMPLAKIKL